MSNEKAWGLRIGGASLPGCGPLFAPFQLPDLVMYSAISIAQTLNFPYGVIMAPVGEEKES